jgi:hypothetical protein
MRSHAGSVWGRRDTLFLAFEGSLILHLEGVAQFDHSWHLGVKQLVSAW